MKTKNLIGMYILTFKEGDVHYQGQIVGEDQGQLLVQLFSWFMGEPTIVLRYTREFVFSEECRLYADHEIWIDAAEKFNAEAERRSQRSKLAARPVPPPPPPPPKVTP